MLLAERPEHLVPHPDEVGQDGTFLKRGLAEDGTTRITQNESEGRFVKKSISNRDDAINAGT